MTRVTFVRAIRQRALLAIASFTTVFGAIMCSGAIAQNVPDCNDPDANLICVHPTQEIIDQAQANGYPYYIGHAEPTLLFFSNSGTSGYNM